MVQSCFGRFDGSVDILSRASVHLRDGSLSSVNVVSTVSYECRRMKDSRGINGSYLLATNSGHYLAVDEQTQWLLVLLPIGRRNLLEQRHI
jgi:hypothetical protein